MIHKLTAATLVAALALALATPAIAATRQGLPQTCRRVPKCAASFWPQSDKDRPGRTVSGAGR